MHLQNNGHVARFMMLAALFAFGCANPDSGTLSKVAADAIADTLRATVREAYDLSKGDVVKRFLSVYPASGRVVSATGGRVSTTRDSLQTSINAFWDGVGQFMIDPTWTWGEMTVDVLSWNAAVMTATYWVPHWTARGSPHVIGGAWTTVWSRTGDGWRIVHEHLSDMPRAMAEQIEAGMTPKDSTATLPR